MILAAYIHLILLILQVCLSKDEEGTKLQEKGNLVERNQKLKPNEEPTHARNVPGAQNVVGHDIVPRKFSSNARGRRPRGMSFHTTFPDVLHGNFRIWRERAKSEQCRSTRHLKTFPTTFFGQTTQTREHFRSTRLLKTFYTTFACKIYKYVVNARVWGVDQFRNQLEPHGGTQRTNEELRLIFFSFPLVFISFWLWFQWILRLFSIAIWTKFLF